MKEKLFFGTISKVKHSFFTKKISESFQETKQHVVDYLEQFQNDYQNELFTLTYFTEFLNPQLFVQFDSEIMEIVVNYYVAI